MHFKEIMEMFLFKKNHVIYTHKKKARVWVTRRAPHNAKVHGLARARTARPKRRFPFLFFWASWRIQTTNQRAAAVVAIHGAADGGSTSGTSHGLARALWEWRGAPRRGGREGQKSNASAGGRRRKEEDEDIRGSPTRDPPDPRTARSAATCMQ